MAEKRKNIFAEETEKIVGNCVANARFEGMICDEENVAAMRRIAAGETTLEAELDAVIAAYQKA